MDTDILKRIVCTCITTSLYCTAQHCRSTIKWKIVKVRSLSGVRLSATPWAAAHQAPPSMGFSRQEHWSGMPLPSLIWAFIITCLDDCSNLQSCSFLFFQVIQLKWSCQNAILTMTLPYLIFIVFLDPKTVAPNLWCTPRELVINRDSDPNPLQA